MSMSNYLEEAIINHLLRNIAYTPAATVYAGILSASQDDGSIHTEFAGGSYARQPATFDASVNGSILSNADIVFPTATADWGTARYIGIFDSAVAGNLLWWGQMRVGKFVATSAIFTIEDGELELDAGGAFSLYSRDGVLNMTLRNAAIPSPVNTWIGLGTATSALNASISEPSSGYARVQVTSGTGWTVLGSGVLRLNSPTATFRSVGADWGAMTDVGIFDAVSGGNLLFALELDPARTIYDGDGMVFDPNSIIVRVE
jgi:hypothetical protein